MTQFPHASSISLLALVQMQFFVLEHVVSAAVEGVAVLFSNVQLSVSAFGGEKTTDSVSCEEGFAII